MAFYAACHRNRWNKLTHRVSVMRRRVRYNPRVQRVIALPRNP